MAYLERRNQSENMARFYRVSIEPDLFGGVAIVRRWGRIGTDGRELRTWHPDAGQAEILADRAVAAKRRRGYAEPQAPLRSAWGVSGRC